MRSEDRVESLIGFFGEEKVMLCNRARLQSCRKPAKIRAGFSPCGIFSASLDIKSHFGGDKDSSTERSATR
jgi:hypothetical protein